MFRNQIVKIETGEHAGKIAKVIRAEGTDVIVEVLGLQEVRLYPIRSLCNTARLSVKQIGDRTHICQLVGRAETEDEKIRLCVMDTHNTGRQDFHIERFFDELKEEVFLIWAIGPHDREAIPCTNPQNV